MKVKLKLSGWQRKRKNNDMKNMMEIKAIMKQGHNDERNKKILINLGRLRGIKDET